MWRVILSERTSAAALCLWLLFAVGAEPFGAHALARGDANVEQRKARARRRGRARAKMSESGAGERVTGNWGGPHVRLVAGDGGATLEFDCAHGEIGVPFETDAGGRFDLSGTYRREGPGPIRVGLPRPTRPARYSGRVEGREMSLAVTLTDTGESLDSYTLLRGSEGRVRKCR